MHMNPESPLQASHKWSSFPVGGVLSLSILFTHNSWPTRPHTLLLISLLSLVVVPLQASAVHVQPQPCPWIWLMINVTSLTWPNWLDTNLWLCLL